MGMFDWLQTGGDMGTGAGGSWDTKMNPNFLQLLAGMGSQFGQGKSAGQAIGDPTAGMIRNMQVQKAGNNMMSSMEPTPIGQAGPDQIEEKTIRTADGTTKTTKVVEPSAKNLNTYGPTVPPEALTQTPSGVSSMGSGNGGVSNGGSTSPFWRALLGQ